MAPDPAAVQSPPPIVRVPVRRRGPKKLYHGKKFRLDDFLDWEPAQPDGWKYEWNHGTAEAFERRMKPEEKRIVDRILSAFESSIPTTRGRLYVETDFILPGEIRVRRPDLSWYTRAQIEDSVSQRSQVPSFVIEIISRYDNNLELERKLDDYFAAGVLCVWMVLPELQAIRVLPTRDHSDTYRSGSRCSAEPALPEFSVEVEKLFDGLAA